MAGFHFRRFPMPGRAYPSFSTRAVACLAVMLLAVMAAGCGIVSGSHTGGQTAGPSAWQLTLNQVHPDGTVGVATALSAFTLAIGAVPGARPVAGPSQPIPSGTLAVQWVLGHWGQLSMPQRRAVLTDLGVSARLASSRSSGGPAGGQPAVLDAMVTSASPAGPAAGQPQDPNIPCLTADSPGAAPYRAEAAGIEHEIAGMTGGGPFSQEVYFTVNSRQLEGKSLMYTYGCSGSQVTQSGAVSGCTVHINPSVVNGHFSAADVHDFLIHELMHCYLFTHLGTD
ncbi:MAG TPA: hypothetical protein VGS19_05770, partial [Streptosporangiaceae bacterium]|nr:hypothetical protein [Streptosporangiaceae bacterium]